MREGLITPLAMTTKTKPGKSARSTSKAATKPRTRRAATSKRSKSPIRDGIGKILSAIGIDGTHSRSRA